MTKRRTRSLLTAPRVAVTLALACGLVLGGGALAYADGTPQPSSSASPSVGTHQPGASGAPKPGSAPTSGTAPKPGTGPMTGKGPTGHGPGRGPGGPGRGPAAPPAVEGTITAVNGSTITVRSDTGSTYTITLGSGATVHQGPQRSLSVGSLKSGERVAVAGTVSGSSVKATDVNVRLSHVDGVVTAVNGSSVTIVDHDGFRRTVDISGVSSASVKVGQRVHAEGIVASDGTTLHASAIGSAPQPGDRHGK